MMQNAIPEGKGHRLRSLARRNKDSLEKGSSAFHFTSMFILKAVGKFRNILYNECVDDAFDVCLSYGSSDDMNYC